MVFQALGGQLESTSWRNRGADQRLSALDHKLPRHPCLPGSRGKEVKAREPISPFLQHRMALKAWSPEEVSALCPEGSEL